MDTAGVFSSKSFRTPWPCLLGCVLLCVAVCAGDQPRLLTYRPAHVNRNTDGGVFVLASGEEATLFFIGSDFTNETRVWVSDQLSCSGDGANLHSFGALQLLDKNGTHANITVQLSVSGKTKFYFCLSESDADDAMKELQGRGDDPALELIIDVVTTKSDLIPLPAEIVFIIVLIVMSGMFSGLNLGLMSLDPTTLKIVMESGSKRQRTYAKLIYSVRKYGNYLLCTLLLGNVLVNSTLAILLENVLGSGILAVVSSTIAIVIFGEIIPQAICSRYGLMIGAYTIWLTYIFMVVTFPLSFPISIILHFILGKEIGSVYTRDELLGLLKVTEGHHGIAKDEVQIISGALQFKEKAAEDVMTKFDDVYCLDIQSVLDFKTMRDIYDSGFSRIPVYEEVKSNIVGVLYAKDLAFVDPDDETPLKQVLKFYNRELTMVYHDTKLDELLEQFARGKCHMAVVSRVNREGPGDPQLEVVGVVTLEDIVEEILQLEIVDETDRIMDNRTLKPSQRKHVDVGEFVEECPADRPHLSPQQRLAIYQFLSTSIDAFKHDKISPAVLKRLLSRDVVRRVSLEEAQRHSRTLYRANSPTSNFTLVIEGHLEVEVGKDNLTFEAGPFYHFGVQSLENALESEASDYVPDFTVRPVSDCLLLVITRSEYLDAYKATLFQQTKDKETSPNPNGSKYSSFLEQLRTGPQNARTSPQPTSARKKQRRRKTKSNRTVDTQCLLSESISEGEGEAEESEGSVDVAKTYTSHFLGTPALATGGAGSDVSVEVELHPVGGREAEPRTSSPNENELKISLQVDPTLHSSQL